MLGQFFALPEAEDHRLHVIVVEQCASENAIIGWLNFLGEIDDGV